MDTSNENKVLAYAAIAEHKTNHVLHLILTLITAGVWSWVWLWIAAGNITKRNKIKKKVGLPTETNIPKILLWINTISVAFILFMIMSASKSHASLYDVKKATTIDEAKSIILTETWSSLAITHLASQEAHFK